MAEEKKIDTKELTEEQHRYLSSFKEAMRAIDDKHKENMKKHIAPPKAYVELVRTGLWRPDLITFQFVLCTRGLSPLSRRLREYIISVGAMAKDIFEATEQHNNKTKKKKQ